ncbi:MFS transporter [Microbispora hainanensis]|uniref:MFS transporter n=1 Tax=Microbispora hainanensis TaxID=568844 RepID=A0A544Z0N0_9ACTN|nr:MFS transporter [Microbispora hainanensis]TQS22614.1 MFS transporter [Microbispora hainanensis]
MMSGIKANRGNLLLVGGFVVAALNLRPALAGVSPLLPAIMRDLGLSPAGGGAITTVMVVCLGLLAPVAPALATRIGLDRTLLAGLLVLAAGVALRSADGVPALYCGAALAGTAIAVMNVVMPGLVKQHFPGRVGLFTGLYVSVMVSGAAMASAAMVPLAGQVGWRVAAGSPALLALVAAALWWVARVRTTGQDAATAGKDAPGTTGQDPATAMAGTGRPRPGDPDRSRPGELGGSRPGDPGGSRSGEPGAPGHRPYATLLRAPATWAVMAFMGLQSLTFYVVLAWLPTVFQAAGLPADEAGYLLGLTNLVQIAAALVVPLHAGRVRSQAPHVALAALLTVGGYLGVLLAPTTTPWLWMVVLGLGQGASIALALLIITLRAPDPASVTALSAVAQSSGYVLAAIGPLAFGLLHELSGGWTVPLLAGLGACVLQLASGVLAARPAPLQTGEPERAG